MLILVLCVYEFHLSFSSHLVLSLVTEVTEISFVKTAQVVKINAQLADDWGDFLYSPSSAGVTS